MGTSLKTLQCVEDLLRPLDMANTRYYFLHRLDSIQQESKITKKFSCDVELRESDKIKLRDAAELLSKSVTIYLRSQHPRWNTIINAFVVRGAALFTQDLRTVWEKGPSATASANGTTIQDFNDLTAVVVEASKAMTDLESKVNEFITLLKKDEYVNFVDIGSLPGMSFLETKGSSVYNTPLPWLPDGDSVPKAGFFMQRVVTASRHVPNYLEATLQVYGIAFKSLLNTIQRKCDALWGIWKDNKTDADFRSEIDEMFTAFHMIKIWATSVPPAKANELSPVQGHVSSFAFKFPDKPNPLRWAAEPAWPVPFAKLPTVITGISGLHYETTQPVQLESSAVFREGSEPSPNSFHLWMDTEDTSLRRNFAASWLACTDGDSRFRFGSIDSVGTAPLARPNIKLQQKVKFNIRFKQPPTVVIFPKSIDATSKEKDTDWNIFPEIVPSSITTEQFIVQLSETTIGKTRVTDLELNYLAVDPTAAGIECGARTVEIKQPFDKVSIPLTEAKFVGRKPVIFWAISGFSVNAKEPIFVYTYCRSASVTKKGFEIEITTRTAKIVRVGVVWLAIDEKWVG